MALQRVRSNMLANNFTLDDDQGLIVGSGNNIYIDTVNNRVGINTNSPTHDFTVNGSIHATGNITAGGDITLGDSDADTITITAEIGSDILPDIDNTYDLGSTGKKWAEVHATTFYGDGSQLTGIAATLNDILTNGNTSALNIDLTGGSVTATSFIGDGSGLTGITASQVTGLTTDDVAEGSNLYFTDARADVRATLRITAADIGNLNNVDETGVANGKVLKYNSTSTNWEVGDADLVADTTPQLGGNLDLNSNDITGTGNINITGDVTATNFIGDGSQLTGLASTLDEVTTNGATTTNSITVGGLIVNSTGAINLPVGTTVQRPTAANGQIRFNSDLVAFEGYDGTEWGALGGGGATYSTTAPTTNLKEGDLWFDTGTTGELYVYSGTEWLSVTGAGGSAFYQRNFVGDNTTTVFNVYGSGNSTVLVYMNGVLVTAPADYSYSNGAITFVTAPALNDEINVLVYGETTGISLGLDGLSDVDLTTTPPTNNQVLKYNGTKWVPGTGEEDLSNNSIGELSNVDITTTPPTNEQVLVWDNANSKFIPGDAAAAFTDLTGTLALAQIPDALITPAKLQSSITIADEFTADGNTATFTLSRDPGSASAIQVYIDSVPQLVSNYTVSGTTLTLPANPSNGSIVEVRGYGVASSVGVPTDGSVTAAKLNNINTGDISEGSNLYYTDARVNTYLSNNDYDTATNIIATITDSAPATLDTLNELAAALGDDPNFATTTANNIATKLPLAGGTLTGDVAINAKLSIDQNDNSDPVLRMDGLNGAFNHGRYGHTLIQNKNNSTSNWWGLSPRDGGNMEISYGSPNAFGSLTSGAIMAFTTAGNVGIGTQSPSAKLTITDENAGQPSLQIRNFSTSATGAFDGDYNVEVRSATSTTTHGTLLHLNENNIGRRTLDVSDSNGIFASFVQGKVGIGTTSPNAPLNIEHTNLSSEPYSALRIKNTSNSGNYYTGIEVDAVGQAHYRYSINGATKWQTRVGVGQGTDRFNIYSWTHGDDMLAIDNSGRMHAKSLSIGTNVNSPPTGNLYSSGDGIIISAGQNAGFSGGSGAGTHLEMGTDSDAGWSSMYLQRYNYGGGGANDDRMFQFTVNTSAAGYIRSTTSGTTYQGSSDYRIKKNIVDLSSTDNIIKQLRPVEFEMTLEEGTDFDGVKHVGFLAHEVQEAGVTDCVSGTKDQVDEDGEPVIQGMDYGRLTPYLVKSLQDALAKIEELETRIQTLEG